MNRNIADVSGLKFWICRWLQIPMEDLNKRTDEEILTLYQTISL